MHVCLISLYCKGYRPPTVILFISKYVSSLGVTNVSNAITAMCYSRCELLKPDGAWRLYLNGGEATLQGHTSHGHKPIRGGGELVIGQASRTARSDYHYDLRYAFLGELGLINIWHREMSDKEIQAVYDDCIFKPCGDAIEWADFRSGTRGAMRIRWPSKILGTNSRRYYCRMAQGAYLEVEYIRNGLSASGTLKYADSGNA